jgi:hypothetical protein
MRVAGGSFIRDFFPPPVHYVDGRILEMDIVVAHYLSLDG